MTDERRGGDTSLGESLRARILVVAPRAEGARLLGERLEGLGLDLEVVASPAGECLDRLATGPDVVVLGLPGDGAGLIREVRRHTSAPLLCLSPPPDPSTREVLREAWPATLLLEPVGDPQLEVTVSEALLRVRSVRERWREALGMWLRQFIDQVPDGVVCVDPAQRIVLVNRMAEEMFGYDGRMARELPLDALLPPGDRARHRAAVEAFRCSAVQGRFMSTRPDVRGLRRDGSTFPAEASIMKLDLGGQPVMAAVVRDITERRRTEEALRASEERFRLHFQNTPTPITAFRRQDGEFYLVDANEASLRLNRGVLEGLMGCPASEIWDDEPELVERLHRCMDGMRVLSEERDYRLRTTGEKRRFLMSFVPVPPAHVMLHLHDVTELRRSEEQLRHKREVLAEAQRVAHLGSWEWDVPEDILIWSDETFRIFGLDPDNDSTFPGGYPDFRDRVHPEDREAVGDAVARALSGRSPYDVEHRIVLPDGSCRVVHERARVHRGPQGNAVRMVGTVQDVTERHRAEQAVRSSEARLASLVDNAPYGIGQLDRQGRFHRANPRMVEILGYSSEAELLDECGLGWAEPEERERLLKALFRGARFGNLQAEWRRRDGHPLVVRISGRTLEADPEAASGAEIFVDDITVTRSLERQLHQAQKMEALGRLAGGVAHDFNNLLMVIRAWAELLHKSEDPRSRRTADQICEAVDRASSLIRQLLAFGRRQAFRPVLLDVNEVVRQVEPLLRRMLPPAVDLVLRLTPDLASVRADGAQLEHALLNLAMNSRDAMPSGGCLEVETTNQLVVPASGGPESASLACVRLAVRDTGVGMDEETRARCFEPFFTTKHAGKGSGLGLPSVYGIVVQCGGEIDLHSTPGAGTTVTILLPAASGAAPEPEEPSGEGPGLQGLVLLADDEDQVRWLLQDFLQQQGFRILAARDGEEALRLLAAAAEPLRLLITDVVMPGMGGRALAARVREQQPGLPVLYISGYSEEAVFGGLPPGDEERLLHKPFSLQELADTIRCTLTTLAPAPLGAIPGGLLED